ncbi:aldehyde dehydrogenase [Brochothrix thermosphacta]|uniref:aldehyde dehydrogenase n=1 Tax=Brochothrix thermosphacta TaxID=2756 RepID=UPI00083FC9A5|nr:aldehyde dehydrogenase [Brochothrix thermosphacta]ODJ50651.1 aldehyde dehydrogenase [Brochothrix thermosphacta]
MRNLEITTLFKQQKNFFKTNKTRPIPFRRQQLENLQQALLTYEKPLLNALEKDLGKSEFESYATEIGFCLKSIKTTLKKLEHWDKPKTVRTPLALFSATSKIYNEPYGVVLIIGPFNYPLQLIIEPLIGALAAGNCAVIKTSEMTPNVSRIISDMIHAHFTEEIVIVVEGVASTTTYLLTLPFNYIFFTGSSVVGKIVYEAAAKLLIPVTLELGGKSPVIVTEDANIKHAAERIVWGKFLNTGQTCIAPDYILVHHSKKAALITTIKEVITAFYDHNTEKNKDYGRIVNEKHFNRLNKIIATDKKYIVAGGKSDANKLFIEPTLLDIPNTSVASMQEEIFGPILPLLTYNDLAEVYTIIDENPTPLALYAFTENKQIATELFDTVSFGGGCWNDTISHVANEHLPFGGVGSSGIGSYHGKTSYDTFSHQKSILKRRSRIRIAFLFPPYKDKIKWLRKFYK